MISNETILAIQKGVQVQVLDIDGVKYTTRKVNDLREAEPSQATLVVATLEGIVEYLAAHSLDADSGIVAHVVDYNRVELISLPYGRFKQRDTHLRATAAWPDGLAFGKFSDVELFIIQLQALFAPSEVRAEVLRVVGSITEEDVRQANDDGVTQQVTARTGIARVGVANVPNPVDLAPFRTFRDIEQPASPFVLRLQSGPKAALFEADGGAWKIEAIQSIKTWLAGRLPDGLPIIG